MFRRPFWKLNGEKEVESFTGWDELDSRNYYSQVIIKTSGYKINFVNNYVYFRWKAG